MGLNDFPEVKMAKRLLSKHSLQVPFIISDLVSEYASILYMVIPLEGVDGVCLNLKTPGKKPKIILNSGITERRKNFTLAHELGHIIIPWHYGTFIDENEGNPHEIDSPYLGLEFEANRFASELLMPFDWIKSIYTINRDEDFLLNQIVEKCSVSEAAGRIRLGNTIRDIESSLIPKELFYDIYYDVKNISDTQEKLISLTNLSVIRVAEIMTKVFQGKLAYCIESNNNVIKSGGSENAYFHHQFKGEPFLKSPYTFYKSHSIFEKNDSRTHWWIFDESFEVPSDERPWREILNAIVKDISPENEETLKKSINGKISGTHGVWKKKKKGDLNQFIHDIILRFNTPEYKPLMEHPDILIFIRKRSEEFFSAE